MGLKIIHRLSNIAQSFFIKRHLLVFYFVIQLLYYSFWQKASFFCNTRILFFVLVGAGITRPHDGRANGDVAGGCSSEGGRAMPAPTGDLAKFGTNQVAVSFFALLTKFHFVL